MSPVGTTVFKDIAASDNDAGENKNIDFAIVAENADIVSYVCFSVMLLLIPSDMHAIYRVMNHTWMYTVHIIMTF